MMCGSARTDKGCCRPNWLCMRRLSSLNITMQRAMACLEEPVPSYFWPQHCQTLNYTVCLSAGVALYNICLKEVPLRKMFLYTSLLGVVLGMTQILLITGASSCI